VTINFLFLTIFFKIFKRYQTFFKNKKMMNEIAKYNVLRWLCYLGVIFFSFLINRNISNNLRFKIGSKIWCPAFGDVARCNLAILVSSMGFFSGFGLLLLAVSADYEEGSFFRFIYRSEPIFSLIQVPVWLGLFRSLTLWTKEVETLGWEIWSLYFYIIINVLFLIISAILCRIEKNVRASHKI